MFPFFRRADPIPEPIADHPPPRCHVRMNADELCRLSGALVHNGGGRGAILINPEDTSFASGISLDDYEAEQDVVNAVKSVPTHYGD